MFVPRRLLPTVGCLLLAWIGTGMCGEGTTLSLCDAIRTAMENNPEMLAMGSALAAQKDDIGVARSFLLPQLTLEERAVRTNNPPNVFMMKLNQERFSSSDFAIDRLNSPGPANDFQTLLSLDQPIFLRKAQVGFRMAKQEYAAKKDDYERKKEEIVLKVAQAYLRILTARAYVGVAQKSVDDAKEHRRVAELKYKSDLGLYSDALRAGTRVTEAEQKLIRTRKDLAVAQRWLGLLLGNAEIVDAEDMKLEVPLRDVEYYAAAASSRRDVSAMKTRQENAKYNIRLAESAYFPTLGVRGAYQLNDRTRVFGSEGDSWLVMAYLKWDLFDGAGREFERSKAQHRAAEADQYLRSLKQFASFKVHEAYLAVEEARKNVELSESALATAEEGKRLVKTRFENDLSPIVDLLDVQLSLDHARASVVARRNDYYMAVINLGYESGTIVNDLQVE
ncbi:MAG: Outer membrane protein TolC precursor [Syntrophorhabdus sp. PtaU1.Bin153]|nr:MAG: Outer membrane protein TolC precursor [Syntrophorhabdus sp. PtaU1.Bin153]